MSSLFSTVTSTGGAPLPLHLPIVPASRDAARSLREDNWENEGGYLAGARPVIASSAISPSDVDTQVTQVRIMENTLASDFANGRVGMRYNNYAHRSRVLRQQKAKLDVLHARFRAQEQRS